MADKPKIEAKIIRIHKGRASFLKTKAAYRTDKFGRELKVDPKSGKPVKPRWSMTWLLDPSEAQAQATIKEIKDEASRQLDIFFGGRDKWPKDNVVTGTKGIIPCFGNANDLPKVYDGYKDMFYVKVSDTIEPIWGAVGGRNVRLLDDGAWHIVDANGQTTEETVPANQAPYGGGYATGRISLYVYNNEQAGVNANFRSVQLLNSTGAAFGGGGSRSAAEELAAMQGDAGKQTGSSGESDPW